MKDQEQTLIEIYRKLSEHDAHALLRYAEFLAGYEASTADIVRQSSVPQAVAGVEAANTIAVPEKIPRPEQERVVDALKRLSASYPMLEKKKLLDKASELVAQHIMFGKPAREVIDEIELVFAKAYDDYVAAAGRR